MNQGTFLRDLNGVVSGDKFLRETELPLHGHIRASNDSYPLVSGDVPTWCGDGISFDDGETAFLEFDIPMDYDQSVDACALRLREMPSADAADTTDLGITTAQALYRAGATVDNTTSTAVAETAVASTGKLVRENILNISGRSYRPGDRVRLTLDANNGGGTELILLGIDLIYGSCVRAFNDDDCFRNIGN